MEMKWLFWPFVLLATALSVAALAAFVFAA